MIEYALKLIVNPLLVVLFSLLVSLILGNVIDTLIAMISLTALRYWTQGHHLKSSDLCIVVSVLIIVAIPQITYIAMPVIQYIEAATLILIVSLSPFNTYEDDLYIKRKAISTIIVSLNICFHFDHVTSIAFALQACDLIKFGSVQNRE